MSLLFLTSGYFYSMYVRNREGTYSHSFIEESFSSTIVEKKEYVLGVTQLLSHLEELDLHSLES